MKKVKFTDICIIQTSVNVNFESIISNRIHPLTFKLRMLTKCYMLFLVIIFDCLRMNFNFQDVKNDASKDPPIFRSNTWQSSRQFILAPTTPLLPTQGKKEKKAMITVA